MKELDLNDNSELSALIKSRFEEAPTHKKDVKSFKYTTPLMTGGKKRAGVRLATTDILLAFMQVFEPGGGELVMHSHGGMDGFWLVMKGAARFYFDDGETKDVGAMEGLTIPRDVKYWFEARGDEPLEILQVDAVHPRVRNTFDPVPEHAANVEEEAAGLILFDAQAE